MTVPLGFLTPSQRPKKETSSLAPAELAVSKTNLANELLEAEEAEKETLPFNSVSAGESMASPTNFETFNLREGFVASEHLSFSN